jgi:hypothetical protein
MKRRDSTYILCLDNNRQFCDDLGKRFSDPAKYTFFSSSSPVDILRESAGISKRRNSKIVLISINGSNLQLSEVESITRDVKYADPFTGLILVHTAERAEEIKKSIVFNIDVYIQRNGNTIPRIHNSVCKLISEHMLRLARKRLRIALFTTVAFLIFTGVFFLLTCLLSPKSY